MVVVVVTLENGERCHGITENIRGGVHGGLQDEDGRGRDGRHGRTRWTPRHDFGRNRS